MRHINGVLFLMVVSFPSGRSARAERRARTWATTLQALVTFHWGQPGDTAVPNVGASGAISAVLGAYLVMLPAASVLTIVFFFLVEVPAVVFLGFWFLFQLWEGGYAVTHPESGGGVAFFAHVGGFLFGVLTVRAFKIRDPLSPRFR